MERKSVALKQLDEAGTGVAVFASLGVIDRDGDVTLPGAFGEQRVKLLPAHDWSHVPIGDARIYERADEAVAEFRLNLEIEAAREWHAALKFDLRDEQPIQQWSYGFDVLKDSRGEHDGKRVRRLEKLRVYEVSPVVVGAGVATRTLAVKSARQLAEQIEDVRAELSALAERIAGLKRLRAAEGRDLSAARREELARVKSALDELLAASQGLCDDEAAETARRLYSEFALARR